MKPLRLLQIALLCLFSAACSRDTLERTGYESLQNLMENECQRDLTSGCPERESYDQYQRKREGL